MPRSMAASYRKSGVAKPVYMAEMWDNIAAMWDKIVADTEKLAESQRGMAKQAASKTG